MGERWKLKLFLPGRSQSSRVEAVASGAQLFRRLRAKVRESLSRMFRTERLQMRLQMATQS
jgi:hypothetical protein